MRVAGARGLRLGVVGAEDFEGAGVAGCSGEGLVVELESSGFWIGEVVRGGKALESIECLLAVLERLCVED